MHLHRQSHPSEFMVGSRGSDELAGWHNGKWRVLTFICWLLLSPRSLPNAAGLSRSWKHTIYQRAAGGGCITCAIPLNLLHLTICCDLCRRELMRFTHSSCRFKARTCPTKVSQSSFAIYSIRQDEMEFFCWWVVVPRGARSNSISAISAGRWQSAGDVRLP